mmetsp:Transcript_21003/g.42335  ORF Transcript_21003/g.42335 Transcript_21003/m.42335 type:complete len:134 (-) Transcript_21003:891-1292(-)
MQLDVTRCGPLSHPDVHAPLATLLALNMQRAVSAASRVARTVATQSKASGKRAFSAGHDTDSGMWQNISIGGFVFVGGMCVYEYKVHMDHVAHGHGYDREANNFPYMNFRLKQYPWSCGDCNLFDAKCMKEKC